MNRGSTIIQLSTQFILIIHYISSTVQPYSTLYTRIKAEQQSSSKIFLDTTNNQQSIRHATHNSSTNTIDNKAIGSDGFLSYGTTQHPVVGEHVTYHTDTVLRTHLLRRLFSFQAASWAKIFLHPYNNEPKPYLMMSPNVAQKA